MSEPTEPTDTGDSPTRPTESTIVSQPATVANCTDDYAKGASYRDGFDTVAHRQYPTS